MKKLYCDNCSQATEVVYRLTSVNPSGLRQVCEDCYDKKPRFYALYVLRMAFAWE